MHTSPIWPYLTFPVHFQSLGPVNFILKSLEISHLSLNISPGHPQQLWNSLVGNTNLRVQRNRKRWGNYYLENSLHIDPPKTLPIPHISRNIQYLSLTFPQSNHSFTESFNKGCCPLTRPAVCPGWYWISSGGKSKSHLSSLGLYRCYLCCQRPCLLT